MGERYWQQVEWSDGSPPVVTPVGPSMTREEVLAEMGAERVYAVRTHVMFFGWCWVIPDHDPRPDGLRGQVWIVKEAADE